MISSVSSVFMITCYVYFKQFYKNLIDNNIEGAEQRKIWTDLLTKKLIIFPLGVVIVVILYIFSFTIIHLAPNVENVKLIRRIADLVTVLICAVLFYLDKIELDKKLAKYIADNAPAPPVEDTI
ncbi:hypothetical protein KXQ82_08020 [Mucilaginibacter sp. HMF5004]|uniref:hypothetical protein n=1 Tax=Mucilaginibacter rivuli TaxID=2857527 RepID=UPI001C5E548F|nr:hypothetical protein [Mucilaginibacter rivuli]MBW4889658.1 hypothetical protein [Mucilaginibacter rivuli]